VVNTATAVALADATAQINQTICTQDCPPSGGACPASETSPQCIDGACEDFIRPDWNTLQIEISDSEVAPVAIERCGSAPGCTVWTVTPDAKVVKVTVGGTTTSTLSTADFQTVDTILRSVAFRKASPSCRADADAGLTQSVVMAVERGPYPDFFDATTCALGGAGGNDEARLYGVVKGY
jgi:hypothetical protein